MLSIDVLFVTFPCLAITALIRSLPLKAEGQDPNTDTNTDTETECESNSSVSSPHQPENSLLSQDSVEDSNVEGEVIQALSNSISESTCSSSSRYCSSSSSTSSSSISDAGTSSEVNLERPHNRKGLLFVFGLCVAIKWAGIKLVPFPVCSSIRTQQMRRSQKVRTSSGGKGSSSIGNLRWVKCWHCTFILTSRFMQWFLLLLFLDNIYLSFLP